MFFLFGINWFSYVLHSALINSLLATFAFYAFSRLTIGLIHSLIFSICIAVLAYPVIGTPFMDHHAVIFSLLSIISFVLAIKGNEKKFWFLSALFIVCSFFSKQIPSTYLFLSLIFILLLQTQFIKNNKNFTYFFYGGFFGLLIIIIIFHIFKINYNDFYIQYILYPSSIGEGRISTLGFDLNNLFFRFKFIYLSFLPIFIVGAKLFFLKKNNTKKIDLVIALLLFLTLIIFIFCQILTKNQILIFFLIPFYLAFSLYFTKKYLKNNFLIYFIYFVLIFSTIKYHLRFNEEKKFMDFNNINYEKSINAKVLDKKLTGLKWITPLYPNQAKYELDLLIEIKNILINDIENKIIITDYLILNAITKNNNFPPNKWFDNLSVPDLKNKYFKNYKTFFINKLKEQKIKNIYIIGQSKLKHFNIIFNDKKNCFELNKINEILTKVTLKNCY